MSIQILAIQFHFYMGIVLVVQMRNTSDQEKSCTSYQNGKMDAPVSSKSDEISNDVSFQ